ncbi:hypothetical protein LEMLEM_LOCUS22170 [Lemmus lemmus]
MTSASYPPSWAFPTENLLLAPFLNCVTPLGVGKKLQVHLYSACLSCLISSFVSQL